jgi:hypothetical protein
VGEPPPTSFVVTPPLMGAPVGEPPAVSFGVTTVGEPPPVFAGTIPPPKARPARSAAMMSAEMFTFRILL